MTSVSDFGKREQRNSVQGLQAFRGKHRIALGAIRKILLVLRLCDSVAADTCRGSAHVQPFTLNVAERSFR